MDGFIIMADFMVSLNSFSSNEKQDDSEKMCSVSKS